MIFVLNDETMVNIHFYLFGMGLCWLGLGLVTMVKKLTPGIGGCSVGRLVHIDFGFILETSPGGNMRFESAHFKLSHEMTQLIDPSGVMKSESWYQFVR